MRKNRQLRAIARSQLKEGALHSGALVTLVFCMVIGFSCFLVVGPWVFGGPLTLGFIGYFMKRARAEPVKLENLFDGFKLFWPSLLLYLLQNIFIALWSCLFIIPGIVKSLSYSMAFYIMRDNPGIEAPEAITQSKKMMAGYKGKLFFLYLSFLGWSLLCLITLGVGFLWLIPYITLSVANFYEDLKQNNTELFAKGQIEAPAPQGTNATAQPVAVAADTGEKPAFCGNCGTKNKIGAKFCGGCGKKIG